MLQLETLRRSRFNTFYKIASKDVPNAWLVICCVLTNPPVVCRQTMQHRHKLHCGPLQNCSCLFLNMKCKPKSFSLCLCVQLRRSWSAWTWRGPWCAGRVLACQTWTVTKSLAGSPAAAWQASWSSPAHRRSDHSPAPTHSPAAWRETTQRRRRWERHRGRAPATGESETLLRWRGHSMCSGLSWRNAVWRETERGQREGNAESKGEVSQRLKRYPTGGGRLSRKITNSWDDLFIFL